MGFPIELQFGPKTDGITRGLCQEDYGTRTHNKILQESQSKPDGIRESDLEKGRCETIRFLDETRWIDIYIDSKGGRRR